MRWLVTGLSGFVGQHFAQAATAAGEDVVGLFIEPELPPPLAALGVRYERGNLSDRASIEAALHHAKPDILLHLAGAASVALSFQEPEKFSHINVQGTLSLLEACRKAPSLKKIILTTSADMYGIVRPEETPLKETAPLRPAHVYAWTKVAVHYLFETYRAMAGLPLVEARPFNQIGPGQAPGFVVPDFARQVALIRKGKAEPVLHVGDLSARRDFLDVRDGAKAFLALGQKGRPGEAYNICRGGAVSARELLEHLIELAGITAEIQIDPAKLRPSPMPLISGDHTKLTTDTGWIPGVPLRQSLADALAEWTEKV